MKEFIKETWAWIKFVLMLISGVFGFLMLVGEAESIEWLLASKIIAIASFIVSYGLYKSLQK